VKYFGYSAHAGACACAPGAHAVLRAPGPFVFRHRRIGKKTSGPISGLTGVYEAGLWLHAQ